MGTRTRILCGLFLLCNALLAGGCNHLERRPGAAVGESGGSETVALPGNAAIALTWIPAGTFMMGQTANEQDAYPNKETPRHRVTLSRGFWLGRYEVTQEQWRAVMGTTPWVGKRYVSDDPKSPAVYVTWDDAQAFIAKLKGVTGKEFRLPTEAEWEYACRAGTTTRFNWGDDPHYEEISRRAWWRGNAQITERECARPVGAMPPNPWGLYDMSGNVSEWCQDWHGYYTDGHATNPTGPSIAEHRVLRGGSWLSVGGYCRSSRRNHDVPSAAHSDIGFRVVCGPAPEEQGGAPEFNDVFVAGQGGVNTFRIPGMLLAPDSSLLVFCEARKESGADASPTDMVLRRSLDCGRTWLPMQALVHGVGKEALMNPCPVVDRENNAIILLCDKANKFGEGHNQHFQLESRDNGATWSEPVDIKARTTNYDDSFNAGPGVGIQLRSGRLVVPGYTGETNDETDENWHSRVLYSDDHGKTWTLGARVAQLSDESQVVELADGKLMLNMRGNMGMSCRGVAISENGGETWSSFHWDRALNECPCQASIVRYSLATQDKKDRLLFANPDNAGEKFGILERTRMTVRLSYDEGKTWPVKRLIHAGPSSYSTMVRLPDGNIGLLFEGGEKHRRQWIRFVRFSLAWLTDGADNL
ncbi:MAG: SUMF1/EgtB/PvdO family nonheme iron enzyme [Candidatus Hydrogenedentes bacterium]|nr:SUMF1/EgtB/PvdO family nonheme iron enzyme [Candidatus Hydrogenedentota bacterium]